MSISKQVAINQIYKLPLDVLGVVKDYCFYDIPTSVMRAVHKANMAEVVDKFTNAYTSGKKRGDEDGDRWGICLAHEDPEVDARDERQFQAEICRQCGNYRFSHTWWVLTGEDVEDEQFWNTTENMEEHMHQRLRCSCER